MSHQSYLPILRMNSVSDSPESCCPSVVPLLMEDKLPGHPAVTIETLFSHPGFLPRGLLAAARVFNFFILITAKDKTTMPTLAKTANNKPETRMAFTFFYPKPMYNYK